MKRTTIKDIAKHINISQGAVSKALAGQKGVSEQTRQKAIEAASLLGYQINPLAQGLSRNEVVIGIVIPNVWEEYYGEFIRGINQGLKKLNDFKISGVYKYMDGLYSKEDINQALSELAEIKVDGVILCPASVTQLSIETPYYRENNIPFILLGTDIDIEERTACVKVKSVMAGKLAGEFLCQLIKQGDEIIAFVGNKDMNEHKEKIAGFCEEISSAGLRIHSVYETQDDPRLAYALAKKILREIPCLGGIYIATGNSESICKAILEMGLAKSIKVVATDVFAGIKPYMDQQVINGVVYQDPVLQGELAIKNVFKCVSQRIACPPQSLVTPNLILKSNFSDYFHHET